MNPCIFNVLHDGRNKSICTIRDSIGLTFECILKKFIDKNRAFGRYVYCHCQVVLKHFTVEYNFHCSSAKHVRWTHHKRVTYAFGNFQCFTEGTGHTRFGFGNTQFFHDFAETVAVFGQVDHIGRSTKDFDTRPGKFAGQVQRCLSAKLHNNSFRFFFVIDTQHIFQGKRLKIQFIGSIIVC
ncbi:hypothetical protein ES705_47142 [subsurface metagenome]